SHTIIRVVNLNYMVFGLVPLFALALALLAEEAGPTRLAAFGLAFLVSGVALLGAYDSPRTLLPNQEFGAEEVAGARWITTERGPSAIFNPLSGFEKRVMNLLYDTPRHENPLRPPREGIIPDHFAFPSPGGPVYLAVPRADIAKYTELYTQIERFSDRDVELLAQRGDVAQVYDSMGIDFYYHPGLRREA
ncbi:MAG TPA: hypothetical protein VJ874_03640, partial [Candidatus Thermoplasmatota archaeon]|nr:hypothetical protein [Candidatus Thermoplasmatota archaeon]